jgi:hypothetical protein
MRSKGDEEQSEDAEWIQQSVEAATRFAVHYDADRDFHADLPEAPSQPGKSSHTIVV